MNVSRYAMKPIGQGDSGARAFASSTITPWAGFDAAAPAQVHLAGNGVVRPKSLKEWLRV